MDETKNIKKRFAAVTAMTLFFFARTLLMIPEQYLGVSVTEGVFTFSSRSLLLWILLAVFSLLASLTAGIIYRKGGEAVTFALLLVIADPLFFILQNNCLTLAVSCIGLLFILNAMREKPVVKNEITFCFFLLISSFLIPYSIFSYIPLAAVIYIFSNIDRFCENAKRWVVLIPAAVCTVVGFAGNKLICERFRSVYTALRHLAFADWEQVGSSRLLVLTVVPVMLIGLICLRQYGKEQSLLSKQSNDGKYLNLPYDMFALCYILSVIGFLFFSNEAFLTANLFFPSMAVTMILSNRTAAGRTAEVFNKGIRKHTFFAAVAFVLYTLLSYAMLNSYIQNAKLIYYAIEY